MYDFSYYAHERIKTFSNTCKINVQVDLKKSCARRFNVTIHKLMLHVRLFSRFPFTPYKVLITCKINVEV